MPITLGCPSCGKRFRARDESAGKRVKCPYCQAAVPVPTAEESAEAGAPTAPLPPVAPPPHPRALLPRRRAPRPPRPAPVASPEDWGAVPSGLAPTAPVPTAPPRAFNPALAPPPEFNPEPDQEPEPKPLPTRERGAKPRPKPAKPEPKPSAPRTETTPDQVLAKRWAAVRRGLFWVQFALLFVALLGFVGFGKAVYTRAVGELPKGEGWVKIDGYINSGGPDAIPLTKTEEIDILTYGVPVFMAGFLLTIGRLFSSGGPRNSGSRGLFALSGLLALVSFVALLSHAVCKKAQFTEEAKYALTAFLLCAPLAEFWFLTALTASGLALKRPAVARAVGFFGFLCALIPVLVLFGLDQYKIHLQPQIQPAEDRLMYEQAALLIGWLILVGAYWRAVRGVRVAARDFIRTVEDAA
ncbi:hypothetical protein J8F10_34475 [Gemmata sp. G18]|uniref:Uncharacterized protein n=1 Tax=Gemmata palustris TaxID=2822762 RepID=A0ABS5C378_9BACT|nr:hypothetical protein [Gemmata palustris]MBP3960363.1 hypothetical protein [Gemmata palustris]